MFLDTSPIIREDTLPNDGKRGLSEEKNYRTNNTYTCVVAFGRKGKTFGSI